MEPAVLVVAVPRQPKPPARINKDDGQVTGFARAYIRAMEVVFDARRRENVIDILTSHVSMTRAIAAGNLTQLTTGPVGFSRDGALSKEGVETVLALRNEFGTPSGDFTDMDEFVDLSYYEEALKTLP